MKTLLVLGERFKLREEPACNRLVRTGQLDKLFAWLVHAGGFHNPHYRERLDALGLRECPPRVCYMNLLPPHPRAGEWDEDLASSIVAANADSFSRWDAVAACGTRVGRALLGRACRLFDVNEDASIMVVPHPSGKSFWWNDPRRVMEGRDAIQRWVAGLDVAEHREEQSQGDTAR